MPCQPTAIPYSQSLLLTAERTRINSFSANTGTDMLPARWPCAVAQTWDPALQARGMLIVLMCQVLHRTSTEGHSYFVET